MLQELLFKTNFDALDCRGKKGYTKGFAAGEIDARGHKVQIYAPQSHECGSVKKMVTLMDLDELEEPVGLDLEDLA